MLVVGGSGFYLRCFFAPVGDDVAVPTSCLTPTEDAGSIPEWTDIYFQFCDRTNPRIYCFEQ